MMLLIDADIPAYRASSAHETEIEWDTDVWSIWTDIAKAKDYFDDLIKKFCDDSGCDEFKLCFTGDYNFRKDVYPEYKTNRKSRKPVGYNALKSWAKEKYPHFEKPMLEGDDCMGILQTKFKGQCGILSMDKDMKTIPGEFYHIDQRLNGEWQTVTEEEAFRNFLFQTLTGDTTDGYPGCKGIGPISAAKLLDTKGVSWETVKAAFIKAKLTEEDALVQARCARILHASDWDFEKNEPILWTP